LLSFSAAIAINIGLGRKPECHCFGQIHSEPIGWAALVRNGALAFLALVVVWQPRTNPGLSIRWVMRNLTAGQLLTGIFDCVTLIASAALFWLVLHLFRQNGRLLLRIDALEAKQALVPQQMPARSAPQGLPIGAKAVPFDLPNARGGRGTLDSFLREGKPLLLISTDPNCGPCNALMPDIAQWQKSLVAELNIVLLSHGRDAENRAKAAEHGLDNVLVEKGHEIAEKYHALGTPTAVLIRSDGTIGSPALGGADSIRRLVASRPWTETGFAMPMKALGQPQRSGSLRPVPPVGSSAPAFRLPDLNGDSIGTANFNGNGTVLLFWNPGCGFCQRMLPEIKKWEGARRADTPRLVLISAGTVDANRAMGLDSTVLIDDKFFVGQLYGANGTPSGLLLDASGRIATELVIGQPRIMEVLAGT